MILASNRSFDANLRLTREVVAVAHSFGVPVEGKLDLVPGAEGKDSGHHPDETAYSDVAEAKLFVEETGVDFLAVPIRMLTGGVRNATETDNRRLRQIDEALGIPLAVQDGAERSDDQLRHLIANGVTKINHDAALAGAAEAARDTRDRTRESR
jgi:fructose/tagatose bisphosphate aldolase